MVHTHSAESRALHACLHPQPQLQTAAESDTHEQAIDCSVSCNTRASRDQLPHYSGKSIITEVPASSCSSSQQQQMLGTDATRHPDARKTWLPPPSRRAPGGERDEAQARQNYLLGHLRLIARPTPVQPADHYHPRAQTT